MSHRKFWATPLGCALAVVILGALVGCGLITNPRPTPTPVPPPIPAPQPVCAGDQTYGCYTNPGTGWVYVCPVYDAAGGVQSTVLESDPSKCPPKVTKPPEPPPVLDADLPPVGHRGINIHPYLQGVDSTPVAVQLHDYCVKVGFPARNTCPLGEDLTAERLAREQAMLGQRCPRWEYRIAGGQWQPCLSAPSEFSCDHFELHNVPPNGCDFETGYFVIPSGKGEVRACSKPGPDGFCGQVIPWDK